MNLDRYAEIVCAGCGVRVFRCVNGKPAANVPYMAHVFTRIKDVGHVTLADGTQIPLTEYPSICSRACLCTVKETWAPKPVVPFYFVDVAWTETVDGEWVSPAWGGEDAGARSDAAQTAEGRTEDRVMTVHETSPGGGAVEVRDVPCPTRDVPKTPTFRYAHPFTCAHCGKTAEQPGELCFPIERKG